MKTQLNKKQFIDLLLTQLPKSDSSQLLIDEAKKLIPSETDQRQIIAIHHSAYVKRAFRVYKQLNSEVPAGVPNIEQVIAWLLDMGAVNYAARLETQLGRINKLVMVYGLISLKSTFTLTAKDMIWLRVDSCPVMIFTRPAPARAEAER